MPGSRPESWRCFVAVPIGDALRAGLERSVSTWRAADDAPNLRWTDPAGWHLTLVFLGATAPPLVPELVAAVTGVARDETAFQLESGGVGAFPRPRAAQTVWYGVADPGRRLSALAGALATALGQDPGSRPFRPHLTLAHSRGGPLAIGSWLAALEPPRGTITVASVDLMRSHLGRGPARYEALASVPLRGAGSMGHG